MGASKNCFRNENERTFDIRVQNIENTGTQHSRYVEDDFSVRTHDVGAAKRRKTQPSN